MRGDTSGKPSYCPTLILIGENGMKIAYGDSIFSDKNSTISVQLTEYGWYQLSPTIESTSSFQQSEYRGEYISRSQFLSVLSNIESVMLRGSFHTDQAESILLRASLEFGKGNKNEVRSNLVEQCACPQGYTGLSCETCDFGYVRAYENITSTEQLGICLPCSCNGHAETCDVALNKCGACVHNTTGERQVLWNFNSKFSLYRFPMTFESNLIRCIFFAIDVNHVRRAFTEMPSLGHRTTANVVLAHLSMTKITFPPRAN